MPFSRFSHYTITHLQGGVCVGLGATVIESQRSLGWKGHLVI